MTAILGVFALDGPPTDDAAVAGMLARMASRGHDRAGIWREGGVVIAITRHEWEFGPDFSGPALIVQDGDHVIAADASLYYKEDLRQKLAAKGVRPKGDTPSHLILAAYQALGEKCAEILEGDFSFILWDKKLRRIVAARDFGGKRPLHYAELDGGRCLVAASSVGAVLDHPACSNDLNIPAIAGICADLWSAHGETCYGSVKMGPAAHTIVAEIGSRVRVRVTRHWNPPPFEGSSSVSFESAADELKELLCRATAERLALSGATTVWLSGGADSPAVFACGQKILQQGTDGRLLLPVSISYPPGDIGREDDFISSIADRWRTSVNWIDSSAIPIFHRPVERAAERDEPFAHAFEPWTRALAAQTRAIGTRIALDGNGGDQLFAVSNEYLADLFRAGSWRTLRSDWRRKGLRGFHKFWARALSPRLPESIRALAQNVGLGQLASRSIDRRLPAWIDPTFARRHALIERDRKNTRKLKAETCSAYEARFFLTQPRFPHVFSLVAEFALEDGVENRSPLYDQRIVAFAAGRPRWEQASGIRTKQLLRRAMRDLLPADVLAVRPYKTGLTRGLFDRGFTDGLPSLSAYAFDASCRLAALGVVDLEKARSAAAEYFRTHDDELGISLFQTLQAELWLRTRAAGDRRPDISIVSSTQADLRNSRNVA